jgi:hypothetical protein
VVLRVTGGFFGPPPDSLDCQANLNRLSRFTPAGYAVVAHPVQHGPSRPRKSTSQLLGLLWVRSGPPAGLTPSTGPCRRPRWAPRWPFLVWARASHSLALTCAESFREVLVTRPLLGRPRARGFCGRFVASSNDGGGIGPRHHLLRWRWALISGCRLAGRRLQGQPVITDTT